MTRILKIALHLFGHLRTFKECLPTFNSQLIADHQCDVFMHTWDETERTTESWYEASGKNLVTTDDLLLIKRFFPNLIYLMGNQNNQDLSRITGAIRTYESLKESLKLRLKYKANVQYDIIIFARPDVYFFKPINLSFLAEMLTDNYFNNKILQGSFSVNVDSIWSKDAFGGRDILMFSNTTAANQLAEMKVSKGILDVPTLFQRDGETRFDNVLLSCNLLGELINIKAPETWTIKRESGFH